MARTSKPRTSRSGSGNSPTKGPSLRACRGCPSLCCKDLAMLIEKPKDKVDVQELRWYVRFDTVSIFIRKHKWYLLAKGRCIYLDASGLCRIYARRPRRCRDHNPPECERYGNFYDVLMTTPEQLDQYLAEKGILRKLGLEPLASGG